MITILVVAGYDHVGKTVIQSACNVTRVTKVLWLPYGPYTHDGRLAASSRKLSVLKALEDKDKLAWPAKLLPLLSEVTSVIWAVTQPAGSDDPQQYRIDQPRAGAAAVLAALASERNGPSKLRFAQLVCVAHGESMPVNQLGLDDKLSVPDGSPYAVKFRPSAVALCDRSTQPPRVILALASRLGLMRPDLVKVAEELVDMALE